MTSAIINVVFIVIASREAARQSCWMRSDKSQEFKKIASLRSQ